MKETLPVQPSSVVIKTNYPFVDWIRMIAMMGIVWAHTQNFEGAKNFPSLNNTTAYLFFMDFLKFGVICFFLISGFLLSSQIESKHPMDYFKRRVQTTLIPYIVAFAGIVLLFILKTNVLHIPSSNTITEYIKTMFFISALWFLPNYLISLFIIICFNKYLGSKLFGLLLLLITLLYTYFFVYSAYAESHVYALFAYIFYLWLGYYIGKVSLQNYFLKLNLCVLLLLCVLLYVASSLESVMLYQNGSKEPMNILRFSNQLYSVIAFITMIRIFKKPISTAFVNPRKETYGIYLYHMFALALLAFIVNALNKHGISTYSDNILVFIGWFIIKFLVSYGLTLLMVKVLLKYNIGYLNVSRNKP